MQESQTEVFGHESSLASPLAGVDEVAGLAAATAAAAAAETRRAGEQKSVKFPPHTRFNKIFSPAA